MSVNRLISFGLFMAFSLFAAIPVLFFSDPYVVEHFAPSPANLTTFLLATLVVHFVKMPLGRAFCALWLIWPVVGSFFSIGHYYLHYLQMPLYMQGANQIYLEISTALVIGFAVISRVFPVPLVSPRKTLHPTIHWLPLLVFPVIYAGTVLSTGPVILSGENITGSIYAGGRGPFYAIRIALVLFFAAVPPVYNFLPKTRRPAFLAYVALAFFVAILDGKRDMAIMGVLVIMFSFVLQTGGRKSGRLVVAGFGMIALYGVISQMRNGVEDIAFSGWIGPATIVGVEYRDFTHSINYWPPEYMRTLNFDFVRSNLSMLMNSRVLEALSIDKTALVFMDSARSWQRAYQSEFGIRIGLIGELHYAFGGYAKAAAFAFGAAAALVFRRLYSASGEMARIFLLTISAALTLTIFSQASAFFGYLLTLVYIAAGIWLWILALSSLRIVHPPGNGRPLLKRAQNAG